MKRRFTSLTDTGLLRSANQDYSYYDSDGRFFIVADGMGGHAGGEEASKIATKEICIYLEENWDSLTSSSDLLKEAFERANQGILKDQANNPERGDMGTTVVVVLFRQDDPWCAHIGDSRLYRLRDLQLEQITEDHTWVAKALKAGDLNIEQAQNHPWRHVLSQCLGRKDLKQPDVQPLDIKSGDRLLLCSDGLTEEVSDDLISTYLQESSTCEEAANQLVKAAKKAGGSDNITVIIIAEE